MGPSPPSAVDVFSDEKRILGNVCLLIFMILSRLAYLRDEHEVSSTTPLRFCTVKAMRPFSFGPTRTVNVPSAKQEYRYSGLDSEKGLQTICPFHCDCWADETTS